MALVVLTRLEARGPRSVPVLLAMTAETERQLASCPGFLGGRALADRRLAFWTLTVWESPAALAGFRERHAAVVARVDEVARAATSTGWRQDGDAVPRWREVRGRIPDAAPPALGLSKRLRPGASRAARVPTSAPAA